MDLKNVHVCPAEIAGILDNRFRRKLQNPETIMGPFVKEGMTVLDLGCGPGFFSVVLAKLVGASGKVIAVDLQEGMLQKVRNKVQGTKLEKRIILHKCEADRIGISEKVDLVNTFYMLHEVPDQKKTLAEIKEILKPDGLLLICEPYLHVSGRAFKNTISKAEALGFVALERPEIFFSRAVLMKKS
ncbi:class I SAM-dependent methyltransferase [Methanolobus sp. WCC4]|uniref:class I SAM-dependent methyltransferase n=1 Tax=Methanolobus sp. WCC4 TaxID=3125784 RepID=UPI0030FB0C15